MKQHPLVTAYKGIDDLQQLKNGFTSIMTQ